MQAARQALVNGRTTNAKSPMAPRATPPPSDPTRQLIWDAMSLGKAPSHPEEAKVPAWVAQLRASKDALWVNGAGESERFVFYEAQTTEKPLVKLEAASPAAPGNSPPRCNALAFNLAIASALSAGTARNISKPILPSRALAQSCTRSTCDSFQSKSPTSSTMLTMKLFFLTAHSPR